MERLARFWARAWKPIIGTALVFLVFACGGGGCSGCAGCGISPIPGAFPNPNRIPNSAQVRLTDHGIAFLEDNISGVVATILPGGLDFPVPPTDMTTSVPVVGSVRVRLCVDGNCNVHAVIHDLDITPTAPNTLHAVIQVEIESRDGAGARASYPLRLGPNGCVFGLCAIDTTCQVDIDTHRGDRTFIALETDIALANIPDDAVHAARAGYTQVEIGEIALVPGQDIEDADIEFGSCSGVSGAIINLVAGLLKSTIIDQLTGQISGLLDGAVGDNLCTRAGEFGCPTGTFPETAGDPMAVCHFTSADASNPCVPILIGTDGRGDLGGSFLGGFSPGTHAPIQFVLASGGDGQALNDGMTLEMIGGFMSMSPDFATSPGHNACVPRIDPPTPFPPVIAQASAFQGNVIPGTTTPMDLGIGIAEDYLDYAGYGMFDSGMLCIGAGTRLSQQLSTGLVSALVRSLGALTFPDTNAALTIAIRPQLPPDFTIGTGTGDPLLTVTLPSVMMDFYVWSTERYIRFMTFQTDMEIVIAMEVMDGQLVPMIVSVTPTNSTITNSELLTESPATLAGVLESVIGSFAGMLGSAISPIALPEIMGFELDIPPGGVRGVSSDGENFLGIFANLRLATPAPIVAPIQTSLELTDLVLDESSMDVEHWAQGPGNTVWLHFSAEGPMAVEYEYSYRIDGAAWSPWTRESRVQIADDVLLFQARHQIEGRARIVGEPGSVDRTPATASLLVDVLAPTVTLDAVTLENGNEVYEATAFDIVSEHALEYRFRVTGGEWSDWSTSNRLGTTDAELAALESALIQVEVRDEAGNVGMAREALIRGLPNPAAGGGCGCRVVGDSSGHEGLGIVGTLFVLGLFVSRRRKLGRGEEGALEARTFRSGSRLSAIVRALIVSTLSASAVFLAVGCSCGSPTVPPGAMGCNDECIPALPTSGDGTICCEMTQMCEAYNLDDLCEAGFTCPVASVEINASCDVSCSACRERPALTQGYMATDLDLVVTPSGDTFVSGYSPGVAPTPLYGDLVFGQVSGTTVEWEIVDGAPTMPITNAISGWRGGVSAAGDDVGRWTAMADSGTNIYIAYYDVTHGALRLAIGGPGAWRVQTVDDVGDAGRYASIVLGASGAPVISYLGFETDAMGVVQSGVRVAFASSAMPGAAADWTITRVGEAASPCRPSLCATGQRCLESGTCAAAGTGCAMCTADQVCVAGTCEAALAADYTEDLMPGHGLYTQLARTSSGLALVYYDRTDGNIYGATGTGMTFGAPFVIDGYARAVPFVGDSGIGASLFVEGDTWHVTYVDGAEEALRYARVEAGAVTIRETVDDGSTSDGTVRHTDGRHIVGDDSSVVVMSGGEVRVAYQDATDQTTMLARRASDGTWTHEVFDDEDHSGFWVEQVISGGESFVGSWWIARMGMTLDNGVRVTQVP
jgi:hypothetical protein